MQVDELEQSFELAERVRPRTAEDRCDEQEQLVDEAGLQERRRERRAALEQERLHPLPGEQPQLVLERPGPQLEPGSGRQRPGTAPPRR